MHLLLPFILLACVLLPGVTAAADPGSEPHAETRLPRAWAEVGLPGPGIGVSGGAGVAYRDTSLVPTRLLVAAPALELAFPCGRRGGLHLVVPLSQTILEAALVPGRFSTGVDVAVVAYRRPRRGGFDLTAGPGLGMRVHTSPGLQQLEGRLWARLGVESPSLRGRFRVGVFLEPWFSLSGGSEGRALGAGVAARVLARWHRGARP